MIGLVILLVCCVAVYQVMRFEDVTISFLDVGQGDAIMIAQGSHQILIDGGSDKTVLLEEIGHVIPFWDRTIEVVIATHPDADHIDGLIGVFEYYAVEQFWYTDAKKESSILDKLMVMAQKEEGVEHVHPIFGEKIFINEYTYLDMIYPYTRVASSNIEDTNDMSIALIAHVGKHQFYLGGDLSSTVEDAFDFAEPITVLKASHHGSDRSTSESFLRAASPQDVIFSVGADNRYGHPHQEVLDRSTKNGSRILRTDHNGRITYQCSRERCAVYHE